MFTKHFVIAAAGIAAMAISPLSVAFSITQVDSLQVDGDLSDWGVVVADGNASHFHPLNPPIGLLGIHSEDQNDSAGDNGFLGPHSGGQNYDAEFMGVALQGSTLYMALVTGQRPDNGFSRYSPGDIIFVTENGLFGIEIGGGEGGKNGDAITEGAGGSTYILDQNGYTKKYKNPGNLQVAGSVWTNVDWILDPFGAQYVQFETNASSQHVGDADYVYTRDSVTRQHAIIELALDTSVFGKNTVYGVFWAPSCDNDELRVTFDPLRTEPPVRIEQVPEPAQLTLFGLGLSMLGLLRRRPARK